MTPLAAYLLLFLAVGIGFIFVHLLAGKLIRPSKPNVEKGTIYECGEPTIGSAWVQFDLRFYVVALLFVIFDVEVAFFFPWAEVFGKANAIVNSPEPGSEETYQDFTDKVMELATPELGEPIRGEKPVNRWSRSRSMRAKKPKELDDKEKRLVSDQREAASDLARMALVEILVFFGVLLVGFAYLWRRGDLNWVRSVAAERAAGNPRPGAVGAMEMEMASKS